MLSQRVVGGYADGGLACLIDAASHDVYVLLERPFIGGPSRNK